MAGDHTVAGDKTGTGHEQQQQLAQDPGGNDMAVHSSGHGSNEAPPAGAASQVALPAAGASSSSGVQTHQNTSSTGNAANELAKQLGIHSAPPAGASASLPGAAKVPGIPTPQQLAEQQPPPYQQQQHYNAAANGSQSQFVMPFEPQPQHPEQQTAMDATHGQQEGIQEEGEQEINAQEHEHQDVELGLQELEQEMQPQQHQEMEMEINQQQLDVPGQLQVLIQQLQQAQNAQQQQQQQPHQMHNAHQHQQVQDAQQAYLELLAWEDEVDLNMFPEEFLLDQGEHFLPPQQWQHYVELLACADEMDLDMFPHDFLLQQGEHFLPLQQVQGQQGLVGQQGMDGEEADAAVADGDFDDADQLPPGTPLL